MRTVRPNALYLFAFGGVAALGMVLGAAVADRFPGDVAVARAVQDIPGEWFARLMDVGNQAGRLTLLMLIAGLVIGLLFFQGSKRGALLIAVTAASYTISPILKMVIERPRPDSVLLEFTESGGGSSFPSGHVFGATIVFGSIFLLADSICGERRRLALAIRVASAALLASTALSRVYVGAHWPSDVVGALLIAGLGVALASRFVLRSRIPA